MLIASPNEKDLVRAYAKALASAMDGSVEKILQTIHDDISLIHSVIPGLTRNPGFFWIPVFAGMTSYALINVTMYKKRSLFLFQVINSALILEHLKIRISILSRISYFVLRISGLSGLGVISD